MLALVLGGCRQESPEEEDQQAVRFEFRLLPGGVGTRAAQTVDRDIFADVVDVALYRRAIGSGASFMLDRVYQVEIEEAVPISGKSYAHAHGEVMIDKKYEYKAVAVAYNSANESSLVSFNRDMFYSRSLELVKEPDYKTPELFFGELRYGASVDDPTGGSETFTYVNNSKAALAGVLRRCVAGVELTLTSVPEYVTAIDLVAKKVNTISMMVSYDDFLETDGLKNSSVGYKVCGWSRGSETGSMTANLKYGNLLAITGESFVVKVTMTTGVAFFDLILMKEVAPTDPDYGKVINDIDLKRNHYYHVRGDYEQLVAPRVPLTISIYPDWVRQQLEWGRE